MIGSTDQEHKDEQIEDRGPPAEMRMTKEELQGAVANVREAGFDLGKAVTIKGCLERIRVLEGLVDDMAEQHNRIIGLIGTMRNEFDTFQRQRVAELQVRVAGGSTTPEDMDGNHD